MTFRLVVPSAPSPFAEVVRLAAPDAAPAEDSERASEDELEVARAQAVIDRDTELLRARYGDCWPEIPAALGRSAASAEAMLVQGPTAIDPDVVTPASAVSHGERLVVAALRLADLVAEEAEVLGEALGCQLADLPLRRLDEVIGSVLQLGVVEDPQPTWAPRAAADAAHMVVEALGAELRETTRRHESLYAAFTDRVLAIPANRLRAAARPWRVIARRKVRRDLLAASRTGRLPGSLTASAHQVREVHSARVRLTELAPLLNRHLGTSGWGPLTDADTVATALAAVRRHQGAVGDRLDEARFARLLASGAFRSREIVVPATNLRTALRSWRVDVTSLCAGDPWALQADGLTAWAARTAGVLSSLATGAEALEAIGRPAETVHSLVDDLLLRENIAELTEWVDARRLASWTDDATSSRSAS